MINRRQFNLFVLSIAALMSLPVGATDRQTTDGILTVTYDIDKDVYQYTQKTEIVWQTIEVTNDRRSMVFNDINEWRGYHGIDTLTEVAFKRLHYNAFVNATRF